MTHHHARLIVVAVATVSFSTPITAQQEPTSPPTVETLVETLGGQVNQNERGEVVGVELSGSEVTDAGLAHLTELPTLEQLYLEDDRWHSNFVGESKLQQALPNCTIPPPTHASGNDLTVT